MPLSGIADIKITKSPLVISHLAQFPAVTVSFNLAEGASLSAAVNEIKRAEQALHLPPSISTSFQGAAQAFQDSLSSEVFLLMAALVTVYLVLGVLYESYIHPVTILSTLPSAGIGALLALMLAGKDLDVIGIIGIVLLIGIVKKNGIMIVDFALEAERKHGKAPEEAIFQASILRFRPILMTTLAAMLGALPLLVGTGTGSELRRPLGLAIIGGLLVSQMLTLFTTPVIYLLFDRLSRRLRPPAVRARGRECSVNISSLFIRRPVATTLLAIAVGLSGLLAYFHLPVAPLPNVTFPVIVVQANMAGASPDIMASTVAEPLERRLATIAGVTELTSTNFVGSSMVVVQFDLNRDINGAARDVEAAIQAARADLPTTLRNNPTYREYNPADSPILILALTSRTLTPAQLYDSASTIIQQQLSQISGVGQITLERQRAALGASRTRTRQAEQLRHWTRGRARRDRGGQCGQRQRSHRSGRSALRGDLQRSGDQGGGLPRSRHRLSQCGTRVPARRRCRRGFQREHPQRGSLQRHADGGRGRLSAARRQHHQDRRPDEESVAVGHRNPAAQHSGAHRTRSLAIGDRRGERHRAQLGNSRGARHRRGVRIPAFAARHADTGGGSAPVHRGNLWPDVPARLQHRQPLADGAHHRHRLRRRRRGRGAGEHRAASRGRARSRSRRRSPAAPRSALR